MKAKRQKFLLAVSTNLILIFIITTIFLISIAGPFSPAFGTPPEYTPLYRGNASKKQVSITFNVYWGTEFIDGILAVLKENNVKATFFIGGAWAEREENTLKKISNEGHEIGNYGFFQIDHKKAGYTKNQEEILITERFIEAIIAYKTNLFAPPSGSFSNTTLKAAFDLGYKTIMWSKDTLDWRDKDENLIFSRATKNLKNGDIVSMHPTQHTLNSLGRILRFYNENGFKAVTVSENIA